MCFQIELHIKIPEWDDIKKPLEKTGNAIQRLWDSIFPGQATRKTALEIQLQSTWDSATSDLELKTEPYTIQNPDKAETKNNIEQWWEDLKQNIALSLGVSVNPQQQEKEQQWLEDNFRFYPNGFAGGLWNVPKNDFMARLHSGEMVLTASQAARYRAQAASGGNIVNNNNSSAMYIDKYYQNSETDAKALLEAMNAMQRRQRKGYGMA